MDIDDAWRNPADAPRAGAHLETAGQRITTTITQELRSSPPSGELLP
jgi:hypothetical protein